MSSYKDKLRTVSETSFGNDTSRPSKKPEEKEKKSKFMETLGDLFTVDYEGRKKKMEKYGRRAEERKQRQQEQMEDPEFREKTRTRKTSQDLRKEKARKNK